MRQEATPEAAVRTTGCDYGSAEADYYFGIKLTCIARAVDMYVQNHQNFVTNHARFVAEFNIAIYSFFYCHEA